MPATRSSLGLHIGGFKSPAIRPAVNGLLSALGNVGKGSGSFNTTGPTLDLVFAGVATTPITGGTTIDLSFTAQSYQVAAQYAVWE